MDNLLKDLRYAFRRILKSPGFTAIALLSLGVGIGTNTAVFTLVEDFLFPELPYRNANELVDVYLTQEVFPYSPMSYPDYLSVREAGTEVFEEVGLAGYGFGQIDRGDQVATLFGEMVSGTYFSTLGLDAAIGRTILPEDDVSAGAHYVLMLSHGYWEREYGRDPGVIGQALVLSGDAYTIIGVAHQDYPGALRGAPVEFFVPIAMWNRLMQGDSDMLASRDDQSLFVKGRLKAGATVQQAEVTLTGVAADLRETFPDVWDDTRAFRVVPTSEVVMNPALDGVLVTASILALVLVGLVLLIACANLASFLVARGTDRKKEIAMRLALGARRGVLIRQLLTETTVLAFLGGVLGMGVSVWLLDYLTAMDLPLPGDLSLEFGLTGRAFLFGLGVTVLTGFLFGLIPALQSTNPDVAPTLKDESTGGGKPRRFTLRNVLVSGQVAASLVLLISAGLFLRSAQARQEVDPGFGQEPTALVTFTVSADRYDAEAGRVFVTEYLERLAHLPQIAAAGVTSHIHLNPASMSTMDLNVDGVEPPPGARFWEIDRSTVDPGFFDAAGIPILRGRNFADTDLPGGVPVAIVNEAFVDRFWPGEDPIGKTVRHESGEEMEIVGVARTTKVRSLGEAPRPFIYWPFNQRYSSYLTAVVQTQGSAETAVQAAFRTLREMDPEAPVMEAKTMEKHLGVLLMPARLGALLSSTFAILALALASIGLYGVVSYAVSRRSREMGIRMALGAQPGSVIRHVVREGMNLVGVGAVLGLGISLVAVRVLQSLLYGVRAIDPLTFLAVPAVLVGITLLAAYVPARRAIRVDPVRALRAE